MVDVNNPRKVLQAPKGVPLSLPSAPCRWNCMSTSMEPSSLKPSYTMAGKSVVRSCPPLGLRESTAPRNPLEKSRVLLLLGSLWESNQPTGRRRWFVGTFPPCAPGLCGLRSARASFWSASHRSRCPLLVRFPLTVWSWKDSALPHNLQKFSSGGKLEHLSCEPHPLRCAGWAPQERTSCP